MSHEARHLEIMRGLQESGDGVGAVIFARRYEGWADFGADGDPELLLAEIELLRSTLGLSEAVRTATGRHIKGNHDASGATHYPSFNLNPLMRRRHQQLVEARAFCFAHAPLKVGRLAKRGAGIYPATRMVAVYCYDVNQTMRAKAPEPQQTNNNKTPKASIRNDIMECPLSTLPRYA